MNREGCEGANEQQVILTDDSRQLPVQFFKKSHHFVFSQLSLTPREHDIMALLLSRLNQEHWQSFIDGTAIRAPVYQFKSDVLCEWLGVTSSNLYNTLSGPAESLANRMIGIQHTDKQEFDYINLFKRLSYKNAVLTIIPNDELMNEYLGISQGHAQVDHCIFRKLKKEHSKRLYPLLCRFKHCSHTLHPQSITFLRGFFGLLNEKGELTKTSFENNKVFIERCIRQPIEEISKHDPTIEFFVDSQGTRGYRTIKQGRKIKKIEFLFQWNLPVSDEESVIRQNLVEESLSIEAAQMVHELVTDFVAGSSGNPTVEELNLMMQHTSMLISLGYVIDAQFMIKFSEAMNEAMNINKISK